MIEEEKIQDFLKLSRGMLIALRQAALELGADKRQLFILYMTTAECLFHMGAKLHMEASGQSPEDAWEELTSELAGKRYRPSLGEKA